jgi:hypothetical protein
MPSGAEHEMYGVLAQKKTIEVGRDSNFGRLLSATGERLFSTQIYRRVYIAHRPMGPSIDYPCAAVLPGEPPEEEYSNLTNQVRYATVVAITACAGTKSPWLALFELLALREKTLEALRTKDRIDMKPGCIHENTTVYSPAFVVPENEGGTWTYSTGFNIVYLVTEPRKEE